MWINIVYVYTANRSEVYQLKQLKTPDSDFTIGEKIMQEQKRRFVGIDLGKRSLSIAIIGTNEKVKHFSVKTDSIGYAKLIKELQSDDIVALEAGNLAFLLYDLIIREAKCRVVVLNPGDIANIYNSLKKTDKEDSLKLARLIQRNPIEELPCVSVPNEYEKECRRILSEQEYWTKGKSRAINRLHSLYVYAGFTFVTKTDIKNEKYRNELADKIGGSLKISADRINEEIMLADKNLGEIEKEIENMLQQKKRMLRS